MDSRIKMMRIFVTGIGGPAGNAALQALKDSKKEYYLIGGDMDKSANGKWICDAFYILPPANSLEYCSKLKDILTKENIALCIVTVDEELLVISKAIKEGFFSDIKVKIPLSEYEKIKICGNKWLAYEHLRKNNFSFPATELVNNTKDLKKAINNIGFPAIFKPLSERGGRGIILLDSEKDAFNNFKESAIIFQKRINGPVYLVSCLLDNESNSICTIVHKRTKKKAKISGTATGAIVVDNSELKQKGERILKSLGMKYLNGIEFMEDENGEYHMIEINPRLCGQSFLSAKAGANFPELLAELVFHDKREKINEFDYGLQFARVWKDMAFK